MTEGTCAPPRGEASRSPAELQGIYGLLSADTTNPEAIRQAHASAVVGRVERFEEIYVLHDTSELAFVDSQGLRMLIVLGRQAAAQGSVISLLSCPNQLKRVLDVAVPQGIPGVEVRTGDK